LPDIIDGQRLIIGVAMDQLRPAALAAASSPAALAAASSPGIGAGRMMNRDA
jgi:hypothetical protein